ncbi:hypothetical protein [Rhodococcus jostii]|uniref:hypothetical protein n=2 Tax=Rhodococcus jostii TaxID=132919 RepID=UPI00365E823A
MTDTDHLFLSRAEIRKLGALLREMPELVEELAVTITRQDRIGTPGSAGKRRGEEQPLPFNVTASEAADDLHTTLVAWVRHVCESRRVDYDGRDGTLGVARWLDRNVIALAMTEGSGEALDEIRYAMRRARWATDRRPEDSTWVDPELVNEARSAIGTAADLEKILRGMGDAALTRKRITYLDRVGELKRIALADGTTVFEVGDVLDAHVRRLASCRHASGEDREHANG